ncbi:MAG TPA: hypothetical protein VHB54_19330 [Mucilaginibacter sp.]|nr:hypothetical protein [Mucilaginibacter sp.]
MTTIVILVIYDPYDLEDVLCGTSIVSGSFMIYRMILTNVSFCPDGRHFRKDVKC